MPASISYKAARAVDVVVIGAGHAGLAISYFLNRQGIDHVVLERGDIAHSWRTQRWDSLRLLTPNWQSQLPGYRYNGSDPHGFMSMQEVVEFISGYAEHSAAPVHTQTEVLSVSKLGDQYQILTTRGAYRARSVVVASGACNKPAMPKIAYHVPSGVTSVTPHQYRRPDDLEDGGVMVVGASATGLQLADEIHQSGRPVTLAVGEHVRMPRTYRGRDIQWWLDASGILNERFDQMDDINRARRLPSPQLIGCNRRKNLDLNAMSDMGIELTGRLMGFREGHAQFSGSLANVCALADLKMGRMLDNMDAWAGTQTGPTDFEAVERFAPTRLPANPKLNVHLERNRIRTIVWATGFRPDYPWLKVPVLDRKGAIKHVGGVTESAGLYVVGLPVLRRRKSSFIHGAEDDARDITNHLVGYLNEVALPQQRCA